MKYKTNELSGARLDQAVAKACGYLYDKNISEDFIVTALDRTIPPRAPEHVHREVCRVVIDGQERSFCPSSEWAHGGPIIDRERIALVGYGGTWDAAVSGFVATDFSISSERGSAGEAEDAPTALVAAMRAFVGANFGAEVDL